MDLDQLKGFYYTAKLRSFTAAAKKLYLTQPAISLKVKALENTVGEKLLERVRRTIRLTAAGEILFQYAEELIGKVDELEHVVDELKGLEKGRLSIGASDTTSIYFLPDLLKSFRKAHPNVELEIQSSFSEGVVAKVLDREVDAGIVTLPQNNSHLKVEPLFSQRFVCIVSEGHRFCDFHGLRISDLIQEPLILLGRQSLTRKLLEDCLVYRGKKLRIVLELGSYEIIKHYVAAGLGVSLVPEKAVDHVVSGLRIVPLKKKLNVEVGVVYRTTHLLSHPAVVFLNMVRDHFKVGGRRDLSASRVRDLTGPSKN
jgi:DNA-binding transcriptional LysR family regulator